MAFNGDNMTSIGGNSRVGVAPMGWSYQSATDELNDVVNGGYFDTFNKQLLAGQFIYVNLDDQKAFITINSVDRVLRQVFIDAEVISAGASIPLIIGVTSNASESSTEEISNGDISVTGKQFIVKDELGLASTNTITVTTAGAQKIDGGDSVVISVNYGVVRLYSDGNNLFSF